MARQGPAVHISAWPHSGHVPLAAYSSRRTAIVNVNRFAFYVRTTIIRVNSGIGLAVDERLERAMKFPRAEEAL